jgi:hypothetical protein
VDRSLQLGSEDFVHAALPVDARQASEGLGHYFDTEMRLAFGPRTGVTDVLM